MTVPVTQVKRLRDAATQVITGLVEMQQVVREIEGLALDWLDEAGNFDEPHVVQAEPEPAPEQTPEPEPAREPEVTLEQARSAMVTLARTKGPEAAKAILTDLGYEKLTDVPAEKYADVMTEAEAAQ